VKSAAKTIGPYLLSSKKVIDGLFLPKS